MTTPADFARIAEIVDLHGADAMYEAAIRAGFTDAELAKLEQLATAPIPTPEDIAEADRITALPGPERTAELARYGITADTDTDTAWRLFLEHRHATG